MAYWMIMSAAGCIVLFIFAILAFIGEEALKIEKKEETTVGLKLLLCSLVSYISII